MPDPIPLPSDVATIEDAALVYLHDLDLRPATIRTYRQALTIYGEYLHVTLKLNPVPIVALDVEALGNFNRWLHEHYAERTVRSYLTAAVNLMKWCDVHDKFPNESFFGRMGRRIDGARGRPHKHYVQRPTDAKAESVIAYYVDQDLPAKGQARIVLLRNRALMAFLFDTAARVSEALAVTREDVQDGRATDVLLQHTKGDDRPRTVFLSEDTRALIVAYLAEREDGPRAPLFVSHGRDGGSALTPQHVWVIVKEAARAIGLYANTSPHSLRHRRAQSLFNAGMPLEWLQALLGHVSPETTRIVYASETDVNRLRDLVREHTE